MSASEDNPNETSPVPSDSEERVEVSFKNPANPANVSGSDSSKAKGKKGPLTPEEQMALYEESLKEDDWGHQPC